MSWGKCLLLFQELTSKLLHNEELCDMALGHDLLDTTPKTQAGGTTVNENTLHSQERVSHALEQGHVAPARLLRKG